jgi:hypothetical protein
LEWFEALFVPVATAIGVPALMTSGMQVRKARYYKRRVGLGEVDAHYRANRLFGLLW